MIYAVFGTISNVCALADRVGGPDKQYGMTAVALLGARYQDMADNTDE